MNGYWRSDRSPEITSEGTIVQCNDVPGASRDQVFNAVWIDSPTGISTGKHYWQVQFTNLSGAAFVGLTDNDKFKKGYFCGGLLYGGNLSGGYRLLVGNFGPNIQSGDTVGILVIFEDEKLKVYFDHNGSPLGLAFDLDITVLDGAFLMVQFSGTGKAEVRKIDDIPVNTKRPEPVYEGLEGTWKCSELNGESPLKDVTLVVSKKQGIPESYLVVLRVVNTINFSTVRLDTGSWEVAGRIRSTKKGSSPALIALERQMTLLVSDPSSIAVEDGVLEISKTEGNTSKWELYSIVKQPVTQNPF